MRRKIKNVLFKVEVIGIVLLTVILVLSVLLLKNTMDKEVILSDKSKAFVSSKAQMIPKIKGIMVLSVDLSKNKRTTIYRKEFDPELKAAYNEFFDKRNVTEFQPLFVRNDDKLNLRITRLINHEFVCSPYSESIAYKFVPTSRKMVTTICSIAVPPSFGEFSGMVSIFLPDEPTEEEKALLQILIKQIADEIAPELRRH